MPRKNAGSVDAARDSGRNETRGRLIGFGRASARVQPRLLGVAVFAQAGGHGSDNPWGDVFHDLSELLKNPKDQGEEPVDSGEPFSTVRPVFCNYVSFKPEIPKGMRAVIEVEGNEQAADPKHGAVEIFVTPRWTPGGAGGWKPPGEPRTTFGGDGGCWVRGPGRLTVHLATDIQPAPKITVRLEKMP